MDSAHERARGGDVAVSPIRTVALDAAHAFELWAIAGGTPHALGLLAAEPGHRRDRAWRRTSALAATDPMVGSA